MHEVTLPQAGNTMEDGTIVKWHKAVGQAVQAGEVLLEVETDKATIEVESTQSGTLLKILADEGQTVPVKTAIALIGEPGEDVSAFGGTQAAEAQPSPVPPSAGHPLPRGEGSAAPAAGPAGVTPVLMPQAGNSMEEGTIVKWHVQPGDRISAGQVIFEVETDKATIEVEAPDAGRLARIVAPEGETVEVKNPVAYLAENDADVDAYLSSAGASAAAPAALECGGQAAALAGSRQAPSPEPQAASLRPHSISEPGARAKVSPAARKLARETGVDVSALPPGRGPGGRIVTDDVRAAAQSGAAAPRSVPTPAGEAARTPLSGMRKAIARNLQASKQTIPHFYMRLTVDAASMYDFYQSQKAQYPCSLNDVVVLACAKALQEFPAFRSRIDGTDLVTGGHSNIGIAVGLDNGLVVPVIVAAEAMTLRKLAEHTREIVAAARKGKIEGLGQGQFTITNLGMFGVEEFSAIINPPESGILAVGAIRETVIVSGGTMRPGKVMTMTLSADHRVVDGLLAAKFMARLKELLEWPAQML